MACNFIDGEIFYVFKETFPMDVCFLSTEIRNSRSFLSRYSCSN